MENKFFEGLFVNIKFIQKYQETQNFTRKPLETLDFENFEILLTHSKITSGLGHFRYFLFNF